MSEHDDFKFEPVPGLPELPPKGETVLWQGRPVAWRLAVEAMGLYWVAGYFVLIALWRGGAAVADHPLPRAFAIGLPYLVLGALACAIILAIAWVQARTTVYTLTTARVAMRVGAALTVTLNLPFRQIGSASLDLRRGGTGTIAFQTLGSTRISYLVCWPHVKPWSARKTEPAFRCIPDAERVARLVAETAETRINQPTITRPAPALAEVAAE